MNFIFDINLYNFSDNDCGNPMVAGYQADIDPDDFTPSITNIKVCI